MNPATLPPVAEDRLPPILLGLGLATFAEFYTFDAINLVLPDIAASFGASPDEASWALTVFGSAFFLGVPLSIWLAAHVRHRRYLLACTGLFLAASVGCACAHRFVVLLVWRALQGFAGAGLAMWWRAAIYLLAPRPQRSRSLMRISIMLYLSTAAGLLFSGYVTDHVGWRLIFVPDVAILAAAMYLLRRYFPDLPLSQEPRHRAVDIPGIALLGIAVVCVQVILARGEADDWLAAPRLQCLAWAGGISMLAFVFWETSARNPAPLLNLALVRDRHMGAAICLGLFAGVILAGALFALPEFLRNVHPQHLDATHAGQIMCVYALVAAAIRPLVTRSIGTFGQRKALTFALCALIAAMVLMAHDISLAAPAGTFAWPLGLYAFCLAPLLSAVGGGTVARLPLASQLDGVAIYMSFRQLGAAFGVAIVPVILHRQERLHAMLLSAHVAHGPAALQRTTATLSALIVQRGGSGPVDARHKALKLVAETVAQQAAASAFADVFLCMAAVGCLGLCFVPLMAPNVTAKP